MGQRTMLELLSQLDGFSSDKNIKARGEEIRVWLASWVHHAGAAHPAGRLPLR